VANKQSKRDRRDAAKRARLEAQRKAARQRTKNKFYGLIAVLAIGGLIAGIVLASGTKPVNIKQLNAAAAAAGCDALVKPPDQGRGHFGSQAEGQAFSYNSNPPTSGKHFSIVGVAPAPTGVHTSPIPDQYQVHNLEHSHVGIQYNNVSADIRDDLEAFTRSHPTFIFMAPRPTMPTGVVLAFTAWDNLISCKTPTSVSAVHSLAKAFFDAFSGRGPEGAIPGTPLSS
jgi:hypothetical protein